MMLRKRLFGLATLMGAAAIIFRLSGCCLIGLKIGEESDASKPDHMMITSWEVRTVKSGTKIDLILKGGDRLSGKYGGLEHIDADIYAESYTKSWEQKPGGVILPALGDTITIINTLGKQGEVEFLGFDYGKFVGGMIAVGRIGTAQQSSAPIKTVDRIADSHGNVVEGEVLGGLISEGKIPLLSAIVLEHEAGRSLIAVDKVYHINVEDVKYGGRLTGFLVGAVIDAVIIAAIIPDSEDEPEPEPTTSGEGSCPFVYSYDGEEYMLDSETFSGSILKAAQRTDWDNLDYLREDQGIYHLKIANELQETEYIDEVKLLVVDHPKDIRVVPSFSGKLHVVSEPQVPLNAVDFKGNEVLELVRAKDEMSWISNPFGRNPENKSEVRDGLVLEFKRPDQADFIKLIFNVQNTFWATEIESHLFKLYGSRLNQWYDLMNSTKGALEGYKESVIREAMLLIKLWDGEGWRSSGFIWFVGTHVSKDQAILLDLHDIPGDVLRVRLESTAGLWMINSVQADYTPDFLLKVSEISPTYARDYRGEDLEGLLSETDGQYYVMPTTEDWAELRFTAPPKKKDDERSTIIQCNG